MILDFSKAFDTIPHRKLFLQAKELLYQQTN